MLNMQNHSREATVTTRRRGEAASLLLKVLLFFYIALNLIVNMYDWSGIWTRAYKIPTQARYQLSKVTELMGPGSNPRTVTNSFRNDTVPMIFLVYL